MRAVIYLRQSLDRTGEGLAIDRQRRDCRALCVQRGWSIVREYVDNDTSASTTKRRPAYSDMLAAIRAGELDAVVVWDIDRLTRRPIEIEEFIALADEHRIALASVGGDADLATDSGRLFARIKGAVARAEIERKSERQRSAARQAAEAGRAYIGRRPFGYEQDCVTSRPAETAALKKAFDDVLHGVPLRQAARELNDAGFVTAQPRRDGSASPWGPRSLRVTLLNPRYAGLRSYAPRELQTRLGSNPAMMRIEGIVIGEDGRPVQAEWEPVVSEDVWRAVVALLTDPERRNVNRRRSDSAMLTGLALCGVCEVPVWGGRNGRSGGNQKVYRCRATRGHVARRQDPIHDYLGDVVCERLSQPDAWDLLDDQGERPDDVAIRTELAAMRVRLESLAADYAEGLITREQLRAGSARLNSRIAEAEAHLARLAEVSVLAPLIESTNIWETWQRYGDDRKRAVVDRLMNVRLLPVGRGVRTFHEETVDITWK